MIIQKPSFQSRLSRFQPVLPVLLYIALIGYFYSFSQYGFNIWDEGGFANGTLRTLNGQHALEDFNPNGYLPGRYLYGAIFFKLFGVDIMSLRLSVILLTPAMIFMVYAISKRIMPPGFALLAALFMLSAPSMYYNRFFPLFTVLNIFCLLNVFDKKRVQDFLLLGGSILLTGYFKFEIALIAMLIALALIAVIVFQEGEPFRFNSRLAKLQPPKPRWLLWVAGGFLATAFLATLWYFLQQGFFGKVFKLVVEAHNVWGNPFPELLPFTTLLEKLGPHKMFERLLFYLPLWVYGAVGIVLTLRFLQTKGKISPTDIALLTLLSFGICVFGLVIWRAGFDNLLRTLPPFYILCCYLLHQAHKKLLHLLAVSGESAQPVASLKKITANIVAVFLPCVFFYEMNVQHGFYAGSIGAMKFETQLVSLDRLRVYTHPSEAKWLEEVVDRIEIYTDKGDPILALPLNPVFYFLTDRINPTLYDWVLPGMLTPEEEQGMVEQLQANPPKMIVYVDIPIDGKEERRLANYAPQLHEFIAKNYRFDELIGLFQILLPNRAHQ
jgi:dolichyl-phosphate-mannose-protein mannosyltransferase